MKSSDDSEDDVHQCGRCKLVFHSIDKYFTHKKAKTCTKVKTSSGAFIKESEGIASDSPLESPPKESVSRPSKKQKLDNETTEIPKADSAPASRSRGRGRGRGRGRRGGRGKSTKSERQKSPDIKPGSSAASKGKEKGLKTLTKEETDSNGEPEKKLSQEEQELPNNEKGDDAEPPESPLGRGKRKTAPKKAWVEDYTDGLDDNEYLTADTPADEDSYDSTWRSPREKPKGRIPRGPSEKAKRKRGRPRKYPLRTGPQRVSKENSTQNESKWQCTLCAYSSPNRDEYDRHIRREHNITHYVCEKCGKPFKDKYKLQRHKALLDCEERTPEWHDSACGKYVYFAPKSARHAAAGVLSDWKSEDKASASANGEPGEDSESDEDTLSAKYGFDCQICGEDCKSYEYIIAHLQKHPNTVPGICKFCGRWFTNKYKVWRHMTSSVHDDVKDAQLNKARKDLSHLRINWKPSPDQKATVERKEFVCSVENCAKIFTSRFAYEAHQKIHGSAPGTTGNRFKCDSCEECFSKRKYYQDHLLYEHGIVDGDLENFTCPVCAKAFTQKTHVFRHFDTLHTPYPQVPDVTVLQDEVFTMEVLDGKKDPKLYSCFVCQKIMAGYTTFYKHIHQHRVWVADTPEGPSADRELIEKIFEEMNQKRHIYEAIQEGVRIKNSSTLLSPKRGKQETDTGAPLPTIDQSALRDLVQPQNLFSFLQDVGNQLPISSSVGQQQQHQPVSQTNQTLDVHTSGQQQQQHVMHYQPQAVQMESLQSDQMLEGLPQADRVPTQGVVHHHPQPQLQNDPHFPSHQNQNLLPQSHPSTIHVNQKQLEAQPAIENTANANEEVKIYHDLNQAPQNQDSRNANPSTSHEDATTSLVFIESTNKNKTVETSTKAAESGKNDQALTSQDQQKSPEEGAGQEIDQENSKYPCPYCLNPFDCLDALAYHKVKTHNLIAVFCCVKKDCRQMFHKALDYQNHDHSQKAFICCFCNDHFEDMADLMAHKTASHRVFEGRRCNVCLKVFPSREALKNHAFEDDNHFPCKNCGKVYGNKAQLTLHEVDHLKLESYLCDICGATFKSKQQLSKHTSTHIARAHKCDQCQAQFQKREHLRRHVITRHTNEKPYVCQIAGCDKSFKRKDKLQEHYRSHSNAKPYKCEQCGKSYRYREGLRYHELTHQKEARYFCNQCNGGFVKPADLRYHMKKEHDVSMKATHSYPCKHCSNIFARPERLKRHLEKEHGVSAEWQYVCNACNKGFAGERSLTTHVKRRHAAHSTGTELLTAQRLLKKKVTKAKDSQDMSIKPDQLITMGTLQALGNVTGQPPKMFTVSAPNISQGDKGPLIQANLATASVQNVNQGNKPALIQQTHANLPHQLQQQPQQQHQQPQSQQQLQQLQQSSPMTLAMATAMPQPIQVQVPTIIRSVPQVSLQPQTSIAMIQPSGATTLTSTAAPVSASPMVLAAHSSFLQQIHLANYQPNVSLQPQTLRPTSTPNTGLAQTQVVGPAVNNQGQVQLQPMTRMMMNTQTQPGAIPVLQTPLHQAQTSQPAQNPNVGFTHLATYATFNNYDFGQPIGQSTNQIIHQQPQLTITPQGPTVNNRTQ